MPEDPLAIRLATTGLCALLLAGLPDRSAATGLPRLMPAMPAGMQPVDEPAEGALEPPFSELNDALEAARRKLEALSKAAEEAKAVASRRQQAAQATAEVERLKSALAVAETRQAELQTAKEALERTLAERERTARDAAAEGRRLNEELVELRWQAQQLKTELAQAQAERSRTDAAAAAQAEADRARTAALERDLAKAREELATAQAALGDAELALAGARAEAGKLNADLASARTAGDQVRVERDAALAGLERARAVEAGLRAGFGELRMAAGAAAESTAQNLAAFEDRIAALTAALTADTEAAEAAAPPAGAAAGSVAAIPAWKPSPPPTRQKPARPATESAAAVVDAAKRPGAKLRPAIAAADGGPAGIELAASLPAPQRLQVASLLRDLAVVKDPRGLKLTVPGTDLFAVNSDRVEPAAHEALARVAELIDIYRDREVLIVGHTDGIGDADYNKDLSARRADLVRRFFIENFGVTPARLVTAGMGESQPVAPNDTVEGRNANRRLEVVILN
jgi:outer membrane protein OmpA-like peptidoglycan-associated protein